MRWRFWRVREPIDIEEAKQAQKRAQAKLDGDKSRGGKVDRVAKEMRQHNEFGELWNRVIREHK